MAVAAVGDRLVYFGGVGARGTESILDVSNDLWSFIPATGEWHRLGAGETGEAWPEPRRCCGFTVMGDEILCWGGSGVRTDGDITHTFLNDLWAFAPQAQRWQPVEPSDDHRQTPTAERRRPEPRYTPIFHAVGDLVVLFGGYTEDRIGKRRMNDLWIYRPHHQSWREITMSDAAAGYARGARWPGPRYGAMSASDAHHVYLCGGAADDRDLLDVWVWHAGDEQWEQLSPDGAAGAPPARYCAACACHAGGLWIFGGRSRHRAKTNFSDTWRFDLASRHWELIEGPAAEHRYDSEATHIGYHAKASAAVLGQRWYLWGGEGRHGHVSDFWRFDFESASWSQLAPARDDDPRFW